MSMNLKNAEEGKEYIIQKIDTEDEELNAFLFSLGCYSGEEITVVSHLKGGCVVSIKDGRYNIDNELAEAIVIWRRSRKFLHIKNNRLIVFFWDIISQN